MNLRAIFACVQVLAVVLLFTGTAQAAVIYTHTDDSTLSPGLVGGGYKQSLGTGINDSLGTFTIKLKAVATGTPPGVANQVLPDQSWIMRLYEYSDANYSVDSNSVCLYQYPNTQMISGDVINQNVFTASCYDKKFVFNPTKYYQLEVGSLSSTLELQAYGSAVGVTPWGDAIKNTNAELDNFGTAYFILTNGLPLIDISSGPADAGYTTSTSPSFTFAANAGSTVLCQLSPTQSDFNPCTSPTTADYSGLTDGSTYTFSVAANNFFGTTTATRTFTVDTTAPTVTLSGTGAASLTASTTITATWSEAVTGFSEADLVLTNATVSDFTAVSSTEYTFTLIPTALGALEVSVGAGAAQDAATNGSTVSNALSYTYVAVPVVTEVTPVVTPSTDTTPDYTFNSDTAGPLTVGGSCSSGTTDAIVGDNTITFNELPVGTYNDCTITVADSFGNPSTPLAVTEFTIESPPPPPPPPSGGGGGGGGQLPVGSSPLSVGFQVLVPTPPPAVLGASTETPAAVAIEHRTEVLTKTPSPVVISEERAPVAPAVQTPAQPIDQKPGKGNNPDQKPAPANKKAEQAAAVGFTNLSFPLWGWIAIIILALIGILFLSRKHR